MPEIVHSSGGTTCHLPLRPRAHTGALSVLTVTALAAALTAVPAAAATVDTSGRHDLVPVTSSGAERAHGDDADR